MRSLRVTRPCFESDGSEKPIDLTGFWRVSARRQALLRAEAKRRRTAPSSALLPGAGNFSAYDRKCRPNSGSRSGECEEHYGLANTGTAITAPRVARMRPQDGKPPYTRISVGRSTPRRRANNAQV